MDINKVKKNLQERNESKKKFLLKLFDSAKSDFNSIVQLIINKYSPKRVVQWGSLLHPEQFNENSDIDIAIEGILDASQYFALLGDAMELTQFSLDIIQLEKIEPEYAEIILMKGKIIYES